jgi:hypothetical protein
MHLRIVLVILVLGGVVFFVGFNEWRLATKAHAVPQRISAADLEAHGPGNNAHIVLSNFLVCEGAFVYETEKTGGKEHWKRVWVPAVPSDSAYAQQVAQAMQGPIVHQPPPPDVRIILKSKADSEQTVQILARSATIQGLVVNEIESLGRDEKKILSENYPGVDFSRCWILEVDKKPAGAGQVIGMMGGGGTVALLGLALLAGLWKSGS